MVCLFLLPLPHYIFVLYFVSMVALPETFRPLLWSYDFDRLDPLTHRKAIIVQAINYGSLSHWRWIAQQYGADAVRDTLSAVPVTEIRPRARRLAALLFDVERFNYVPRGAH